MSHPFTYLEVSTILDHYLVALVWSTTHTYMNDDGTEGETVELDSIDATYSDNILADSRKDIENFLDTATEMLEAKGYTWDDYLNLGHDEEQIGHDFALTRNWHGAGFWDRGDGDIGDILTAASKVLGGADAYLGDDGLIYIQ